MNISSLYQYASVYNQSYNSLATSAVQASQQGDSGSFDSVLGAMFSNSDGDTVQLSAQGIAMGGGNSDIKNFLDKVASGTVTDSDLQSMQSELKQAEQQSGSTQSASSTTTSASDIGSDIKNFLDKVASGTVTDSDIQSMQSELKQAEQQSGSTQSASSTITSASDIGSDIKNFLDKVASGTVTDSDIQSMQSELKQAEQQSGSTQSTSKTAGPPRPRRACRRCRPRALIPRRPQAIPRATTIPIIQRSRLNCSLH